MTSLFKKIKAYIILLCFIFINAWANCQEKEDKWRLNLSLGVNNPIDNGKNDGYYTKYINFPSVNLGVQHMLTSSFGAKLDYGFNRAVNDSGSIVFKLNYSRVNIQGVYNASNDLLFLPETLGVSVHLGSGISFTKPLGNDTENTYTYANLLTGLEISYEVSESMRVFSDISYAYSLSRKDKYDSVIDGFSFN